MLKASYWCALAGTMSVMQAFGAGPTVENRTWKGVNGVYDGVVTDAVHWVNGALPEALTLATFSQNADYTVCVPDDGYETLATFKLAGYAGRTFSFDTRDSYLFQKANASDTYYSQSFQIHADDKPLARLETEHYAAAQTRIADSLLTVKSATADPGQPFPSFSVTGGLFNMLDPDGTLPGYFNDWKVFVGSAAASARIAYSNCTVRLPNVHVFGGQTGDAELSFVACPVLVKGQMKFYDNNRQEPATNLVRFAGGKRATLEGGLYLDNTKDWQGVRMAKAAHFVVTGEGTTLDVGTGLTYGGNWDNTLILEIRDGAAVSFAGGVAWPFAVAPASGTPNPKARAELTVADASLTFGSPSSPAKELTFGRGYDALGALTVSGDSTVDVYAGAHQSFGYDGGSVPGEGSLTVKGGAVTFHEGSNYRIYLGNGEMTTGRVSVVGGRLTVEGGYGLGVQKGVGFVTVSGGELAVSRLPICSEESEAGESVVRQIGGVITVTPRTETAKSLSDMKGVQITTNGKLTRRARLVLDGGVMNANYVIGGSSARVNGGTGYAAFEANGGTLKANAAAPFLLETFDEAKLGEDGLTIDSDYAATIRQAFSNQDGAEGLLVLKGAGEKTLVGASAVTRIRIEGGTVSFGAEACPQSSVAVSGGATVNFNGGAADGRLTGLAVSGGKLAVAAGETFAVSGDVVLSDVHLVLSGTFEKGTAYTILSCTGSVSEDSAKAWRDALVASGIAEGLAGDFTVEVKDGVTSFKLTVRDAQDVVIRVDEGVSNVEESVTFAAGDTLRMIVADGAQLNLNGTVRRGALAKEGPGAAILAGEGNASSGKATIESGLLGATSIAAFGWSDPLNPGALLLKDGTLGLADEVADAEFPWTVMTAPSADDKACVIKADSDVTLKHLALGTGCLIKRGAGRLTFAAPSGTVTFSSSAGKNEAGGTVDKATTVEFPEGGCPPQANYAGLTIAEGELRLTGGASYQVASGSTPGVTYVGIPVKGIGAEPGIVVDGTTARFSSQGSRHFHLGCGITDANSDVRHPHLIATNGATVNVTSFVTGRDSSGSVAPYVYFNGSTLNVSEYLYTLRGGTEGATPTYSFVNGSRLHVDYAGYHGVEFQGGYVTMVFDNSVLARNAGNDRARIWTYDGTGRMVFRNGSVMYVDDFFQSMDNKRLTLAFDGGEWSPSSGDYTLALAYPKSIVFTAEKGGLFLNPPAGATWTMSAATFAAGAGEVIHRGAGTLAFAEGVTEKGVRYAGTGTLTGSLNAPVLSVTLDGDGTAVEMLCLKDVSVTGRIHVDLGRTAENPFVEPYPQGIAVARFSGSIPDVRTWKVEGTGVKGVSGVCRIVGDTVVADVCARGCAILVR